MNRIKTIKVISLLLAFLGTTYLVWRITRPVEIVGVHTSPSTTDRIVLSNLPLTDKGLINWWEENKDFINKKYGVPNVDPDGTFWITIWDVGNGYEKYDDSKGIHFFKSAPDQVCFEDMKKEKNCLSKDKYIMRVYKTLDGIVVYRVRGTSYYQKKNGEIVKDKSF